MLKISIYLALVVADSSLLKAQTPPLSRLPDRIVSSENGMRDLELRFQNDSGKTIIMYSIHLTAKEDGKVMDQFMKMYMTPNPKASGILPGGIVSLPVTHKLNAATSVTTFDAKVAMVLFSDQTSYGESTNAHEYKLDGQLSGALMERDRLKRLLIDKGESAVIAELKSDDGIPRNRSASGSLSKN